MSNPTIHHAADLSKYNTMALSCVADMAIEVQSMDDIRYAHACAKDANLPIFVLSGGSNVLLPSALHACVILPKFDEFTVISEDETHVDIAAGAGLVWHDFIKQCLDKGWFGLENLALIPGLVGACPVQNIGAYGAQVSDFITKVIAYDLHTGETLTFDNAECQFAYRDSFFKQNPNRYIISQVQFRLHKDRSKTNISYGDLSAKAHELAMQNGNSAPQPQDVFTAVVAIRQSKLPDPALLPNCGSFFQNPIIAKSHYVKLLEQYADLPHYPAGDDTVKVPAGWLIDRAGLKGDGVAPILTHKNQALVLTNHAPHTATQTDIKTAQDFIICTIDERFGIALVREPVWVYAHVTHD
ncbi:UDP-N-acetylenolpyruvoylglucosamine reductase [Moraxella caviae]|uniref:UDP-N-acetylenolpyruvoylglucosamine reductase n=1 Tax=Moraxella caviae TaxID=34060 RepID=A0A1S9ZU32_9GAMM|nr:UDP-N-acetylmuramate dehydrogenase [Moraxella caviae]OOR87014.1 UDP-N-acetylenolpyruvoylglucosamine reductase [Moraxella caviae]STZ10023.1 UDP-N-acetylenolpyruvoylglucosamine reductase [Moraxella caviae]VEW13214.1 UDP-N-acetylenolpyruvoylglucosamine reductase [Moraxella caviae]